MTDEPSSDERELGLLPVSSVTLELAVYLIIGAWLVWIINQSLQWTNPDDWMLPRFVGIIGLLLVAVKITSLALSNYDKSLSELVIPDLGAIEAGDASPDGDSISDLVGQDEESTSDVSKTAQELNLIVALSWIIMSLALINYLGFFSVIPIAMVTFMLYFGKGVKIALLLTICYTTFLYVLYVVIIGIIPHDGLLFVFHTSPPH